MAYKTKESKQDEGKNTRNRTNNTPSVARNIPNNEPNSKAHPSGKHPERLSGPKSGEEPRTGTEMDQ